MRLLGFLSTKKGSQSKRLTSVEGLLTRKKERRAKHIK
jgi:hypothetical protein